ncbi:MAG: dihydroorotase [Dehalococcoidia bacterium]|nr:dihydroorotase [Dehalococcoidia bacterium]
MNILIKNGQIINPEENQKKYSDIFIRNGIIEKIGINLVCNKNTKIINAKGLTITPGFIDLHSHLRQPGFEYKETVASGTLAAAKGGFTTICAMPNTNPTIDNKNSLEKLKDIILSSAKVNVLPIGAITVSRQGKKLAPISTLSNNGVVAISDDGDDLSDVKLLKSAMNIAKKSKLPISQHCEDPILIKDGHMHEGWVSNRLGLQGRPREAEINMIERDIAIAKELGAHLHIAHISTKEGVMLIKKAKKDNIKITAEVTPHHLTLTHEAVSKPADFQNRKSINYNTNAKVNPPLREDDDVLACIKGINDNTIDAIATDHAPHAKREKEIEFPKAAPGISGLESAFAVGMTLVKSHSITFEKLISKMTIDPVNAWNLNKIHGLEGIGTIIEGNKADLAIIDENKKWVFKKDQILSKGKNNPFIQSEFTGKVVITIHNGNIVYSEINN